MKPKSNKQKKQQLRNKAEEKAALRLRERPQVKQYVLTKKQSIYDYVDEIFGKSQLEYSHPANQTQRLIESAIYVLRPEQRQWNS